MHVITYNSYTAIEPPITLYETDYTKENTYNKSMRSEGTDTVYTYFVHSGAEFGVECSSIATPENEFAGEITWYKKTTGL